MRVLLVHNRYRSDSPSGEDRVVDQEGSALAAAGHDVHRFERFSDDISTWSLPRQALVPARVVWSRGSRRSLIEVLHHVQPDVVHVHNTFPLLSPSVLYACRETGVPSVVTFHNYRPVCANGTLFRDGAVCHDCVGHLPLAGLRHGCYRESRLATAPLAAAIVRHRSIWREIPSAYIFISEAERDLFSSLRLPSRRVFVKPNLVPDPGRHDVAREHKIVFLGRLTDTKGLPILMEAWDRYLQEAPFGTLRLAVAGAGPLERDLEAWSAGRPSVDLVGPLDRRAAADLVASALAVVAPSLWEETFGLVALEAMAAGVAPVASARGAFPELIRHGENGLLFDPGAPGDLLTIFKLVDSDPERLLALGRQARLTYERRFDPATNLEQLISVYRFACEHHR